MYDRGAVFISIAAVWQGSRRGERKNRRRILAASREDPGMPQNMRYTVTYVCQTYKKQ